MGKLSADDFANHVTNPSFTTSGIKDTYHNVHYTVFIRGPSLIRCVVVVAIILCLHIGGNDQ
jgi:hypothetical protein